MLSALILTLAVPAAAPERDPTWLVASGWSVERGDRACVALRQPADGGTVAMVSQPGHGDLLFLGRDNWDSARNAPTFTLGWRNSANIENVLTAPDKLWDGPFGFGFYIDPIAMQAIGDAQFGLFVGDDAKGEPLARYAFPYFDYVLASTRQCGKTLALEVKPRPPSAGEGLAVPVVPGAQLVSNADYPPVLLRAKEQGRVSVRLDIAEDGYPDACTVTATTAPQRLSEWTCRLLRWRTRFVPRLGADGKPARQKYVGTMDWSLPTD